MPRKCDDCDGKGEIPISVAPSAVPQVQEAGTSWQDCPRCDGTGEIPGPSDRLPSGQVHDQHTGGRP